MRQRAGALRRAVVMAALILFAGGALAQEARKVQVATRVVPPLVIEGAGGQLSGFSIELWQAIASDLNWETRFILIKTLPEMLGAVERREADLAISAISITAEREKRFDFSQPILDAGLQIMTRAGRGEPPIYSTLWQVVSAPSMRDLMVVFLVLMLLPVPLIWWFERRHPESFTRSERSGARVVRILWWSTTALAGQANDVPSTFAGRVLAALWMFIGIVFVSYFTATVTASLTVKQLDATIGSLEDLRNKRVASVGGSSAQAYLAGRRLNVIPFTSAGEAVEALVAGKVEAVVYDAPTLQFIAAQSGQDKVMVVGEVLKPESYGILFPEGSPLRKAVNESLLRLKENGTHETLRRKYFAAGGARDK